MSQYIYLYGGTISTVSVNKDRANIAITIFVLIGSSTVHKFCNNTMDEHLICTRWPSQHYTYATYITLPILPRQHCKNTNNSLLFFTVSPVSYSSPVTVDIRYKHVAIQCTHSTYCTLIPLPFARATIVVFIRYFKKMYHTMLNKDIEYFCNMEIYNVQPGWTLS